MEPPVLHVATSREKAAQQPDEPDEAGARHGASQVIRVLVAFDAAVHLVWREDYVQER